MITAGDLNNELLQYSGHEDRSNGIQINPLFRKIYYSGHLVSYSGHDLNNGQVKFHSSKESVIQILIVQFFCPKNLMLQHFCRGGGEAQGEEEL